MADCQDPCLAGCFVPSFAPPRNATELAHAQSIAIDVLVDIEGYCVGDVRFLLGDFLVSPRPTRLRRSGEESTSRAARNFAAERRPWSAASLPSVHRVPISASHHHPPSSPLSPLVLNMSSSSSSSSNQSRSQSAPMASESNADDVMSMRRLQLRRVLRSLDEVKGVGTSLISLMIPPSGSLQRVLTKLHDELALSEQIQSRV